MAIPVSLFVRHNNVITPDLGKHHCSINASRKNSKNRTEIAGSNDSLFYFFWLPSLFPRAYKFIFWFIQQRSFNCTCQMTLFSQDKGWADFEIRFLLLSISAIQTA